MDPSLLRLTIDKKQDGVGSPAFVRFNFEVILQF